MMQRKNTHSLRLYPFTPFGRVRKLLQRDRHFRSVSELFDQLEEAARVVGIERNNQIKIHRGPHKPMQNDGHAAHDNIAYAFVFHRLQQLKINHRWRTRSTYRSKLSFISRSESPANFSRIASAISKAAMASAATPAAGTAITSDRMTSAVKGSLVSTLTERSGFINVEIGFLATEMTMGSPVVMPPSKPPALLEPR